MTTMQSRLIFGSMMIAVIVGIVAMDATLSSRALAARQTGEGSLLTCALPMTLLIVVLAIFASYEMAQLCAAGGFRPVGHWAAIVAAGLSFLPWLDMHKKLGTFNASPTSVETQIALSTWWVTGGLLGSCLACLLRRTTERALANMALTLFIILYVGLLGSFAVRIRCMDPGARGAALVVYFILTVKSSDIGAYFTGRAIGKHKLVPWLSPGKTVEGAAGAVIFAALIGAGGILLWPQVPAFGPPPLTLTQAIIFGAVMAISGHLGDLTESAFKRDMGVKDSGRFLPAFGGLLDILDSPLFTAPIAWWVFIFCAS